VIIDHGRTVAAGTPQELKRRAGRNVIEVHVREPEDLARVAAALALTNHGEPQIEESTRRVSIAVEAGIDRLKDALQALDTAGASVEDVSLRPPKLDEVFLALTGKALEETTDQTAAKVAA
jgi:ABC-2 type transport system ATP-binding protein